MQTGRVKCYSITVVMCVLDWWSCNEMLILERCVQTDRGELYNCCVILILEMRVHAGRGELYECNIDHGDVCAD